MRYVEDLSSNLIDISLVMTFIICVVVCSINQGVNIYFWGLVSCFDTHKMTPDDNTSEGATMLTRRISRFMA